MTQNELVLQHLITHSYITQIIGSNYGIRRVAARINDLKNQGVFIEVEMKTDDAGVRYAYYKMSAAERRYQKRVQKYAEAA